MNVQIAIVSTHIKKIPSICPICKSDMTGTLKDKIYYPRPKDYEYIYEEGE